MVGFQTGSGKGGREGLTPRSRWFAVAKWQALAVREVARELRLAHVWSWGWAQRDERSNDPDKTFAACVWLWARDPALCDAESILGTELDTDVRTGQLSLPSGTRCAYGSSLITASSVAALAKVTRDRELALTALVVRAIERERTRVSPFEQVAVERRIVGTRFGGSVASYRAALAEVGASVPVARGIIGDELRLREILGRLAAARPTTRDIARFRSTYAPVLAREIVVSPAPSWLPTGRGIALATSAPEAVFSLSTGQRQTIRTVNGEFTVEALEDTTALGAIPYELAWRAIVDALQVERRAEAYEAWTIQAQKAAASQLVCERDRMPELSVVDLSPYAPFLSLDEPEAASWASARR